MHTHYSSASVSSRNIQLDVQALFGLFFLSLSFCHSSLVILKYYVYLAPSLTSHYSIFFTLFMGLISVTRCIFFFFLVPKLIELREKRRRRRNPEQTEQVKEEEKKEEEEETQENKESNSQPRRRKKKKKKKNQTTNPREERKKKVKRCG